MLVVNPGSTKTVEIDGAKFKIGILPFGKKVEIQAAAHFIREKTNPEQVREIFKVNYEYVRWGVKGHSGVQFQDGSEVPFKSVKEKLGDVEYDVVAPETMEIYSMSITLLSKLCNEVTAMNYLGEQETKN